MSDFSETWDSFAFMYETNVFPTQIYLQQSPVKLVNKYLFQIIGWSPLSLHSKISPVLEEEIHVVYNFLEYSTCYDTLSYSELFGLSGSYDIRGKSLNLIQANFVKMLRYVCYVTVKSPIGSHKWKVSLGSEKI